MSVPYPLCQATIHLDNGVDVEPLGHHCSKSAEKSIEVGNAKIMLCAQCAAAITGEAWDHGAELLGISVDGAWCHEAFAKDRHLHFPLLSDFEPKGAVSRKYGAYRESDGYCERALFVIDGDGRVTWSYCSPVAVNPGADGIIKALESMRK